jgi:hypothetical protein
MKLAAVSAPTRKPAARDSAPVRTQLRAVPPLSLPDAPRTGALPAPRAQGPSSLVAVRGAQCVAHRGFDWDDNVFFMPTKNWAFDVQTGEGRAFGTAEWPAVRAQLGKPGPYERFAITDHSFDEFKDDPTGRTNPFLDDVERALAAGGTAWQGPSWKAFVASCGTKEGAAATTIITARTHSPEAIHAALVRLVERGLLKHAPPLANVFPVTHPSLAQKVGATPADPSRGKANVIIGLLDELHAQGGRAWSFSDDDANNFERAVEMLRPLVDAGRWPDMKVTIRFSGLHHETLRPHAVVL